MNEEQTKALFNLIEQAKKESLTGNIQLNWFKGAVGTVQILRSYKLDSLVENFSEVVINS